MKFLDSNVILYAYLKPKPGLKLPERIKWRKSKSKELIKRIENGLEEIIISTVHLGEILNIISKKLGKKQAILFLSKILALKNVHVVEVSRDTYEEALSVSISENLEPNDAIAIVIMRKLKCKEIYTFDHDFQKIEDIVTPLLGEEKHHFTEKNI